MREAGILKRLRRVPGPNATIGLYAAAEATALPDALVSLPIYKWMDITVEALAKHPQKK